MDSWVYTMANTLAMNEINIAADYADFDTVNGLHGYYIQYSNYT